MAEVEPGPAPRKILVVSYSQSGQLAEIVNSLVAPLQDAGMLIEHEVLRPVPPFPFPWSLYRFLDAFPESFQEIGCPLEPFKTNSDESFDLVIIAYQVWYLSPSRTVSSLLQHPDAKRLLQNKSVVTVVGARNMWYRAHERIKDHLRMTEARMIGHIALTERAFNLISVITLVNWMLSGSKERLWGVFPRSGIAKEDIARCACFGRIIAEALSHGRAADLQTRLNKAGACRVVPHLMALEHIAARTFCLWSRLILCTGNLQMRRFLIRTFGFFLACGLVLLSPLSFLWFYLTFPFRRAAVQRRIDSVYRY